MLFIVLACCFLSISFLCKDRRLKYLLMACSILVSLFSPNEIYKPIKLLLFSSCGLIMEGRLCDYKDIIATFVGALNRIIIQY